MFFFPHWLTVVIVWISMAFVQCSTRRSKRCWQSWHCGLSCSLNGNMSWSSCPPIQTHSVFLCALVIFLSLSVSCAFLCENYSWCVWGRLLFGTGVLCCEQLVSCSFSLYFLLVFAFALLSVLLCTGSRKCMTSVLSSLEPNRITTTVPSMLSFVVNAFPVCTWVSPTQNMTKCVYV